MSSVTNYYASEQMLYDGIRTLLPEDNIYFHTGEFRYSWMKTKDNLLERMSLYFTRRKYERLLKEEFAKDNIKLIDDRFNSAFTYSIGKRKDLLEKYFDHSANGDNYIFSIKGNDLSLDDLKQINFKLIWDYVFMNYNMNREIFDKIIFLLNSYPFFCCSFEGSIAFATTLYSKKEATKRLKKVAKPYGLSLHVGDFFSKQ